MKEYISHMYTNYGNNHSLISLCTNQKKVKYFVILSNGYEISLNILLLNIVIGV